MLSGRINRFSLVRWREHPLDDDDDDDKLAAAVVDVVPREDGDFFFIPPMLQTVGRMDRVALVYCAVCSNACC